MDQNVPLVFPGQSQSVEEERPISSPPPSSASSVPEDQVLTKKCPSPSGSGDGAPGPVEELLRQAGIHLQSLVRERATCEEVLTRQISGLSSSSSKEGRGQVEQLLEDAREEQERILSLTEKVEQLTGVTQSSRLRQGLDTWQEDIQEIHQATTNNQDITSLIGNMVRTIGSIRTLVWTLPSTSTSASY